MAAINFPDSPTPNQVYTDGTHSWQWDSTSSAWISSTSNTGAGGSNTQILFNNNTAVGGTANLTYNLNQNLFSVGTSTLYANVTSNNVGVRTTSPSYQLDVVGKVRASNGTLSTANSASSYTSPLAWNSDFNDVIIITALANALTINADSGSPVDGQKMIFRIKDSGTARALTWTTGSSKAFREVGVTLPTTTTISKNLYVGFVYNSADSRWDAISLAQEA